MKLRTVILLSLFIFGLAPMAAVIALNLPMVQNQLETLVQRGQLQNLRVEFGDLEQFLASRKEMVRVLAKLPEPGALLSGDPGTHSLFSGKNSRGLTQWINQILRAGQDIYQVIYLDRNGDEKFRLVRDRLGKPLRSVAPARDPDNRFYFQIGMAMNGEGTYVSPIKFTPQPVGTETYHPMIMRMVSPVVGQDGTPEGVVLCSMDVAGLPNAYPNTLWVMSSGRYLPNPSSRGRLENAFDDYSGLKEIFAKEALALGRGADGSQVIWVPLFSTEQLGPLWVGRRVDPSDIETFQKSLQQRVLIIFALMFASVLVLARWIALRVARYGEELKTGIGRVLDCQPGVVFSWRGPQELQMLARDLTRLADEHARTTQDLVARARELEDSNRFKSEFLANMSHELRTPLNAILLLSKILGDNSPGNLSADQVKQARVIHSAGSDLLSLIDDILEISKIEAKKTTLHLQRIDPRHFWRPLLEIFEPMARNKGLQLQWQVADDLPESMVSDEDRLRLILRNFLSNAVKFTEKGRVALRVEHNQAQDAKQRPLRISVEDTGIGIPEDKQKVVFEAFRQADGSTNRRYGGTGLGLAISKEFAELLGGRIEVVSEEGGGARFSLVLPLEVDTAQVDPGLVSFAEDGQVRAPVAEVPALTETPRSGQEDSEPEGADEPALRGKRILVVADDVRDLLSLTPLLEGWGLEVTAAGSGAEALETLESDPAFDWVLLDIMMQGHDDTEAIRRLRDQERRVPLPMLALTGEDDGPFLAAGAVEVLRKPVEPPVLRATLRDALKQGVKPNL